MQTASLNRDNYLIDDGNDSKVIITDLAGLPGGTVLDVTGWSEDAIRAGHIIIKNAAGDYAPLGVTGGAYDSLAQGESYFGVLKVSTLKKQPIAAILTMGEVNAAASPYPVTDTIKAALPAIKFLY